MISVDDAGADELLDYKILPSGTLCPGMMTFLKEGFKHACF